MKRNLLSLVVLLVLGVFAPSAAFADETMPLLSLGQGPGATVPSTSAPASSTASTVKAGIYGLVPAVRSSARLDVAAGSSANGARVQIYGDNTTPAQRWRFEALGSGYYRIVSVASGKVLDVAAGKVKNNAVVQLYEWNGTPAQRWKLVAVDGGYRIVSALSDDYALDVAAASSKDGARVQLYEANGTLAQVWSLRGVSAAVENGIYRLQSLASGKTLDVVAGSVDASSNVQQYASNGTPAQYFSLRYDRKTGYYTVVSANSGLVLDVQAGSVRNGGNVQVYPWNATLAQKWSVEKNADGTLVLRSAKSGKALDVAAASTRNGANVQVYAPNGTPAQKWKAVRVDNWLPDGIYHFVTANSSKFALDVAKGARSAGANVQSARRSYTSWNQSWVVCQVGSTGYYTIRNLNSRMALSVSGPSAANGANICQGAMNKSDSQLWKPVLVTGGVVWTSKIDPTFVLDMAANGKKAGTNTQLYARNNTAAQKFRMKQEGVDALLRVSAFVVRNLSTGQVLDVTAASTKNGAAMQTYASNGTPAQKFRLKSNGGGYSVVNTNSNKALDIDTVSKSKLQQWQTARSANQRWQVAFDLGSATFTFRSNYAGKSLDGASKKLSLRTANSGDTQRWVLLPTTADYFRVYLNSGHGWNSYGNGGFDTGARGNGYREADFCSDLSDLVLKYCRELYGLDIIDGRPYRLAYWNRLPKAVELGCSVIFSIHFDAGGGSGPMTMVGVDGRHPASLTFNSIMQKHLYGSLPGLPGRRTSYRNDITCVNGSIPAVLAEVCFMDNARDVNYYLPRKDKVARALAAGLYEASQHQSLRKPA